MPLFRALAKNMAPMTNADESPTSPTNHRDYKRIEASSRYKFSQARGSN